MPPTTDEMFYGYPMPPQGHPCPSRTRIVDDDEIHEDEDEDNEDEHKSPPPPFA
jgi:hypothetical protein